VAKKRSKKPKGKLVKVSKQSAVRLLGKRNRNERRRAEVYRLEPLLDRDDPDILAMHAPDHHIEGTFGEYVVVSVPESCNMARAEEIKAQVMAMVKRPVVVMSHNITLLKATKLSSSEAAECIRKGEQYAEAMQQRVADIASDVDAPVQSDGSGQRLQESRPSGGLPVGEVGAADTGDAGSGGNGEVPEKSDAGSPGIG
jgi:hypothetical protein